jgi:hypothetical protein
MLGNLYIHLGELNVVPLQDTPITDTGVEEEVVALNEEGPQLPQDRRNPEATMNVQSTPNREDFVSKTEHRR